MKSVQKMVCGILLVATALFMLGCQSSGGAKTAGQKTVEAQTAALEQAAAPQPAQVKQAIAAGAPKIKVANPEYDFGVVGPDSKENKGQFEFTNVGKGVLKIDHVQSTCGCTVPELSKKEYQPGESGVITFTFHAPATAGNVTKHLYIVSNDPEYPRVELALKAGVEVKVTAEPAKVELFLNKENAGMPSIKVKSVDNTPFAITSFTSTEQIASYPFDPNNKQVEHVFTPTIDVSKLTGTNIGTMIIGVDHPKAKQVVVTYNALPTYELRPARIVIQNAEPEVAVKRQVGVVNNYGQPFEIESIQSRAGMMKVVEQKKEGSSIMLDIEIIPPKQAGTVRRYISDELDVKIKDGPVLSIRCSGWYKL